MTIAGVLLAAGASTRMRGVDKLMEPVRGQPLLRDRAKLFASTRLDPLIVVLPQGNTDRAAALNGIACTMVENPDAATGMASSIISAIEFLSGTDCEAALIMPADMPDITHDHINLLLDAQENNPARIHRACTDSHQPGSPVIFPRAYFAELMALRGDESGRAVLKAHADQVDLIPLSGDSATRDLDTPEAWANWRTANPSL